MSRDELSRDLSLNCLTIFQLSQRGLMNPNSAWVEKVRMFLRELLIFKSEAICERVAGFQCSEAHPGYLYYTYNNVRVYFPWLIMDDIPEQDILNYLIATGVKIKASSISFTCLSGSALYFNSLNVLVT